MFSSRVFIYLPSLQIYKVTILKSRTKKFQQQGSAGLCYMVGKQCVEHAMQRLGESARLKDNSSLIAR